MTPGMREALHEAHKGPLRRVHDGSEGKPPWPAPAASLAALVKHGLLVRSERKSKSGNRLDEWTITEDGQRALNPPAVVRRGAVRSLRVPGGSTRMMQLGSWVDARTPEPEPVDPDEVDGAWFGAAARRHAEARDRRHRAEQIASKRKAA